MLRLINMALAILWTLLLVSAGAASTSDYRTSLDDFSGDFFTKAIAQSENRDKNTVVSPISGHIAMTLLAMGAKGETKREILDAIHLDNIEDATTSIKKTMHNLRHVKGATLKLATKIFAKPARNGKLNSVVSSYEYRIKNAFRTTVEQVDFSRSASAARTINKWVDENTDHRINNIIDEDSLSSQTSAVVVNAIYFKGKWNKKFNPKWTKNQNFGTIDGSSVKVDMMYQDDSFLFGYSSDLESRVVEIPYEKNDVSMVVILPDDFYGIKALEHQLKQGGISKYLENLTIERITLGIPRMLIKTTIDVKNVFLNLGVRRVFSPDKSEVDGIIEGEPKLYVSKATQKVFLEVNEEGAEGAAATGVGVIQLSASPQMICDHPFVFIIRTKDAVLFMGSFYGK